MSSVLSKVDCGVVLGLYRSWINMLYSMKIENIDLDSFSLYKKNDQSSILLWATRLINIFIYTSFYTPTLSSSGRCVHRSPNVPTTEYTSSRLSLVHFESNWSFTANLTVSIQLICFLFLFQGWTMPDTVSRGIQFLRSQCSKQPLLFCNQYFSSFTFSDARSEKVPTWIRTTQSSELFGL